MEGEEKEVLKGVLLAAVLKVLAALPVVEEEEVALAEVPEGEALEAFLVA